MLLCTGSSLVVASGGLLFIVVRGLLIVVASLVSEPATLRVQSSIVVARGLQSAGLVVVVHGLSCSMA